MYKVIAQLSGLIKESSQMHHNFISEHNQTVIPETNERFCQFFIRIENDCYHRKMARF
jgi:hypothetical protein